MCTPCVGTSLQIQGAPGGAAAPNEGAALAPAPAFDTADDPDQAPGPDYYNLYASDYEAGELEEELVLITDATMD